MILLIVFWICFVFFMDFAIQAGYYFPVKYSNPKFKSIFNLFGTAIFGGIGIFGLVDYYIIYKITDRVETGNLTRYIISCLICFFFLILGYYIRVRKEEKKKSQIQNESE